MAQAYLKKRLTQIERDDIKVFSRGTNAPSLSTTTPEVISVLKEIGVDASGHNSMMLNDQDIKEADLILVMEKFQKDEILVRSPSTKDKIYLLAEFGIWGGKIQDAPLEIHDPIGASLSVYKDTFAIIKNSVERLVKILI
jgi:protein-tyrosine-phosphatase